jgi:putative oxidoreductase
MSTITSLGRYLFALPLLAFGVFHLMGANQMAEQMQPPLGAIGVYLSGIGMLAAAISVFIGKYDKLAMVLTALLMVIYVVAIHLPGLNGPMAQMAQVSILKDIMIAGGALMYAHSLARDNSIIG